MKRGFTYILALMILSMSIAYSLDSFMDVPTEHAEVSYMNEFEQHHHQGDSVDCDHCCHSSSHITGITSQALQASKIQSDVFVIIYNEQLSFNSQTPPTPPPTA